MQQRLSPTDRPPISRWIASRVRHARSVFNRKRLEFRTVSKKEFIQDLRKAVDAGAGYAAGKTGLSQQYWMYYPILRQKRAGTAALAQFEEKLKHHAFKTGVFPCDSDFCLEYNRFYIHHIKNLDCLGLFYQPWDLEIVNPYDLKSKLVFFTDQEPDRSVPSREDACYLQYFRNKRLLLVSPFAEILQQRATKEIFEGVWSNTGKQWFYPSSVDYLEFPYGFSAETQQKFSSTLDLFKHIATEIRKKQFDVALIAAGALAIPIASYVKALGKVGIDLGGHLQVLFGVTGKRWRVEQFDKWKVYFNDFWMNMPDRYRPKEVAAGLRDSSYW